MYENGVTQELRTGQLCFGVCYAYNEKSTRRGTTRGRGQMDEILDKLRRIRQLWKKQERLKIGTPEHEALMQQIRALSAEYQALIDTPKKPRKSK
jgi:hypothetical protein